jgi:flagellar hook protein FlgE
MDISSIALGGLGAAQSQFNKAASSIAANSAGAGPADTVDLSSSAVALLSAKETYGANLATVKVADEMSQQTIDLIG